MPDPDANANSRDAIDRLVDHIMETLAHTDDTNDWPQTAREEKELLTCIYHAASQLIPRIHDQYTRTRDARAATDAMNRVCRLLTDVINTQDALQTLDKEPAHE